MGIELTFEAWEGKRAEKMRHGKSQTRAIIAADGWGRVDCQIQQFCRLLSFVHNPPSEQRQNAVPLKALAV